LSNIKQNKTVTRYGIEIDLSYEHKTACPRCRANGNDKSGNNLHCYGLDDLGRHRGAQCFSCDFPIISEEYMEKSGFGYEYDEEFDSMGQEFNKDIHDKLKSYTGVDSKGYRGIPTDISKFFGTRYEYSEETGEVVKSYYPITKKYEISGYKVRAHPKDFRNPFGEVGKDCDLVGQFRFKTHAGICVIVGGEIDQLSAYAMLKPLQKDKKYDEIAVVSSSVGESATFKQVQGQYEWLSQFKKIVICMDNDDAGRAATEALAEVLPKGKVYVMNMRRKDPNSYLWDKDREQAVNFVSEFVSDFWAMKPYTPQGVKSASEAFDEIEEELLKERITLPPYMYKMQEMMGGGIIQGRIMNIISDTSIGKSTHVNRMVHHWIYHSPVIPTIVSLEATAGQYMLEMVGVHLEKNLRWSMTDVELIAWLKTEHGQAVKQDLCFYPDGTPRFYLIDNRDKSIKELEDQMEKLNKKHGSKLFVIDVLTDLLRGSSEDHSEDHMNWQRNMNKGGTTIVNVLHTRKPGQTQDGKARKVTEYDALGTGSFVQSAAYNLVLNRDKLADDPLIKNTTEADLPKCRGGKTGKAGDWFYDFQKMTCYDKDDYLKENPELKYQ
jgi:archaellum biogenesis ATPase FlaH